MSNVHYDPDYYTDENGRPDVEAMEADYRADLGDHLRALQKEGEL